MLTPLDNSNLNSAGTTETACSFQNWHAHLELVFEQRQHRTHLTQRRHSGPLRIQKPLYPEGDNPCHAIILHPPGGIASGDQQHIDVDLQPNAHALLTTPGATKWYRSTGQQSLQTLVLRAEADSVLEWLPQENIVFDAAHAALHTRLELGKSARMIGWDITCLGRQASRERFTQGQIIQHIDFYRAGKLVWSERGRIQGNDPLLSSAAGLQGHTVYGTLWLAGMNAQSALCRTLLSLLREKAFPQGTCAVTALPDVTLIRALSSSCEALRQHFIQLWQIIRPHWLARPAHLPRIWAT